MKPQLVLLAGGCLLYAGLVLAEESTIQLPQETAVLKTSALPGYQIALQKCSICHSADYINLQPPHKNLQQWRAEVSKMQHAYGAPVTDEEVQLISEYLAETYGDAH